MVEPYTDDPEGQNLAVMPAVGADRDPADAEAAVARHHAFQRSLRPCRVVQRASAVARRQIGAPRGPPPDRRSGSGHPGICLTARSNSWSTWLASAYRSFGSTWVHRTTTRRTSRFSEGSWRIIALASRASSSAAGRLPRAPVRPHRRRLGHDPRGDWGRYARVRAVLPRSGHRQSPNSFGPGRSCVGASPGPFLTLSGSWAVTRPACRRPPARGCVRPLGPSAGARPRRPSAARPGQTGLLGAGPAARAPRRATRR